jgi:hypothetical protein
MLGRILFGATTVGGGLTAMRTGVFGRNELEYRNESPEDVNNGKQYELKYHYKLPFYDNVYVNETSFYNDYPYSYNPNYMETRYGTWNSINEWYFRPVDVKIYPPNDGVPNVVSNGWDYRKCEYIPELFKN